ncbi:carboxypeptidase-like regulatory domain-containing protein [Microbacterium paraoxydans]|uniref:Carboxypeptidase regulatory-like domain-containing protein n=1 Tax=Microbacterium paraoxydans TaxID=199592 RepID=A0A1H1RVR8_9MICO|nr:carboxypeptidase-like regulatory domain-containing protein [Microbacterium paraoxydans]SDS39765.1 Carboxypeptidase regulatory-like domain-containing protein [Microbacterium paraoxydans]
MARRRAFFRSIMGGAAALALALGGATAAGAASRGSLAGTVTAEADGSPLAGVTVSVSTDDASVFESTMTDATGAYLVPDLPAGEYVVAFDASGTDFIPEFWDDASSRAAAQRLIVAEGDSVVGVDAALALGGAIAGIVRHQADGSPLEGVTVRAESADYSVSAFASTDADGAYRLAALPAGDYRVRFEPADPTLSAEFWEDAYDESRAKAVHVTAGQSTERVDAYLAELGVIQGTMTLAADDSPVPGWVTASDATTGLTLQADVAPDGSYSLTVPPGRYVVAFVPDGGRGIREYWKNARREEDATTIAVAQGQIVSDIDATLDSSGMITGVVRTSGALSGDAIVEAYSGDTLVGMAYTQPDGSYRLAVPAGTYIVRATANVYDMIFAPQFFDGVATRAEATPVVLAAGGDRAGVDFDLATGGAIGGNVSTADGAAVSGATVTALLWTASGWQEVAALDTEGSFVLGAGSTPETPGGSLPAGVYTLRVEMAGYCTAYFGGAESLLGAGTFRLESGAVLSARDVMLSSECTAPQSPPALALSQESILAGEVLKISGSGFAPGEAVVIELRSEPTELGELVAGIDGAFSDDFRIPAGFPAGSHTVVALNAQGDVVASAALNVVAGASGGASTPPQGQDDLAATGGELPSFAVTMAAGLLLAGAMLLRRRRQQG